MPFTVDRDTAEVKLLKKWNWSHLLNRVEYFDEILYTYWYLDWLPSYVHILLAYIFDIDKI